MSTSGSPAISVFYTCTVDGIDLGNWSTCSGLNIAIQTDDKASSSLSFHMTHQAKSVTFGNVTLGRPVGPYTAQLITWLEQFAKVPSPGTVEIVALDQTGSPIVTWDLHGVTGVKWVGPSFDASAPKVAQEQLVLAYQELELQ